MEIKAVAAVLGKFGLAPPQLAALKADRSNYTVCLLQPKGDIEAHPLGVRHRDKDDAERQFSAFIDNALERDADLAVTPEYSMPWVVLRKALEAGRVPSEGKLWALGCESITYAELATLRDDMADVARFVFEDLPNVPDRFLDPLAYVFQAPRKRGDKTELVVLVQFKTTPMSDVDSYEIKNLQTGTAVYQFGESGSIRLVSLICSDVLSFTSAFAQQIHDRGLVLHIQLNPKPRQAQFKLYRENLLAISADQTELICLNWASGVSEHSGGKTKNWKNIANSAWYLRPSKFDSRDETLATNHKKGLYYTFGRDHQFHVLFLNFAPGLFVLDASKVAHIGVPAVASRRTGPYLSDMLEWNGASWTEALAEDGFDGVVGEAGDAKACLAALSAINPLFVERLLTISAGGICSAEHWHRVDKLASCAIDQTEIIRRMTFCQDPDQGATEFRVQRLKLCRQLMAILQTASNLPPALDDFEAGFELTWSPDLPHRNAVSTSGEPATVVYMGETASDVDLHATRDRLEEFLRRFGPDDDAALRARQRLAVWHRDGDELRLLDSHKHVRIDAVKTTSPFDLAKEE